MNKSSEAKLISLRKITTGSIIALLIIAGILCLILPGVELATWRGILAGSIFGVSASLLATVIYTWIYEKAENKMESILNLGLIDAWQNRQGRKPGDEQIIHWLDIVKQAKTRCVIMGVSLSGYCEGRSWDDFCKHLAQILEKSIPIEFNILFLDPQCPAALLRAREEFESGKHNTFERIHRGIEKFWEFRKSLDTSNKFKMYVYTKTPTFSATLADNYMIVTHYLPHEANKDCPAYGLADFRFYKKTEGLYHVYDQNLRTMIEKAEEITDDNVGSLLSYAKEKSAEFRREEK